MAWQTPKTNWRAADVVSKDDFNRIEGNTQYLKDEIDLHLVDNVLNSRGNRIYHVEVVSSSGSEMPKAGRIIFDTSQGKFFGGNGSGWV